MKDQILSAAAFDVGWARRDLKRALLDADEANELSAEQVHHLVLLNIKSAEWENARLLPLLTALADVAEALDKCILEQDRFFTNFAAVETAMHKLRALLPKADPK